MNCVPAANGATPPGLIGAGLRKDDSSGALNVPPGLDTNGMPCPAKFPASAGGEPLMAEKRSSKLGEASAGRVVGGALGWSSGPGRAPAACIGGAVTLIRPLSDFATQPLGSRKVGP